ncbi:MAG: flavin reductase family protein [Planctomycetota bacterium]|nr:flavin reductase family protein [Planctomycetota bacterium]MDA1139318.1 flavin reductase family protein [Planctomycetota bacterium]
MADIPPYVIALGKIPSGLSIVTAGTGEHPTGFLASWVQQVSFDPLQLVICIKKGRYIHEMLMKEGTFTVNLLAKDDGVHLKHFSRGFDPGVEAFEGVSSELGENGVPFLTEALGHLECKVVASSCPGDHNLVVGELTGGSLNGNRDPYVHIRSSGKSY